MAPQQTAAAPRRVTLVADEMLGYVRTGGIGTATTFLAVALARMGHRVELLYVGDRPTVAMGPEWERLYASAGVAIRMLARSGEPVQPPYFGRMRDTELALRADPPDVVVTQDLAAPVYTALRLRQLGLAFERTLFVVYCHGTRRWITDMARKPRVLPGALAVTILEQASVELADVAVSPSAYLIEWMRRQGWTLPARSLVIPYLTRSAATGEPRPAAAPAGERVERIAFFGRLEERKGLRPFAAGLNELSPELLQDVELEFVGAATPAWPADRVQALLSGRTKQAFRRISFETNLDQPEALARLSRPGTLAVMPSFGETFSNAVQECLERGIPFIASDAGAPPELIAPEDRARVLFEPTPEGVAAALRRAFSDKEALRPARPAFDPGAGYDSWAEVIAMEPQLRPRAATHADVDVVVRRRGSAADPAASNAEWVVLLREGDVPDDDLVDTLVSAQAASGADVVTCGVRLPTGVQHFFLGEPGGLGVVANHYGTAALIRRSLLTGKPTAWTGQGDPDWPLLAGLSIGGAHVVSLPRALVAQQAQPGDIERHPADALLVLEQFEHHLPRELRSLARLAGGLAASASVPAPARRRVEHLLRRLSRR